MEITSEIVTKVEAVFVAENMMGCGGDGMGWHRKESAWRWLEECDPDKDKGVGGGEGE